MSFLFSQQQVNDHTDAAAIAIRQDFHLALKHLFSASKELVKATIDLVTNILIIAVCRHYRLRSIRAVLGCLSLLLLYGMSRSDKDSDNDYEKHAGSSSSTSSLLRIIALAARALRKGDMYADDAEALRTLREARELTRPWLRDVEARRAQGKRGFRAFILVKMYDKVRAFHDEARGEIERLERRGRKKHGKDRPRRRHRSRDRTGYSDETSKARFDSSPQSTGCDRSTGLSPKNPSTKTSNHTYTSSRPSLSLRQRGQQQRPGQGFGAGRRAAQYPQVSPLAQPSGGPAAQDFGYAANLGGKQPMQHPLGAQYPQSGTARPGPPAPTGHHSRVGDPPGINPQAKQYTPGESAGVDGMQGTPIFGSGQPYAPYTTQTADVPRGSASVPIGANVPSITRTAVGGPDTSTQGEHLRPNQPTPYREPFRGGGFMPPNAMPDNGGTRAATHPAVTTTHSFQTTSSHRPGARTNPADASIPGQPGLVPHDEGRSTRSTHATSVASRADGESTLMPDDASHYSGRQHRWTKGKGQEAPEPQMSGACRSSGIPSANPSQSNRMENARNSAGQAPQVASRSAPGTSSRAESNGASAVKFVEETSSNSSNSSSSDASSSSSSSEGGPSSSSRTTMRPSSTHQPSLYHGQYAATPGSHPAPIFPGSSARMSTRSSKPAADGIPYNASQQADRQAYAPQAASSSHRTHRPASHYGATPAPVPDPRQQQHATTPIPVPGSYTGASPATQGYAASSSRAAPSLHASAAHPIYATSNLAPSHHPTAYEASTRISTIDMGFIRPALKKKCHHVGSQAPSDCDSVVNSQDSDSDDE